MRIKCKGICNNPQGKESIKPIVRQTTQSRFNYGIKIKIYSTLFLYSKEGWFTMVGSRLQETQSSHNKGQDPITPN